MSRYYDPEDDKSAGKKVNSNVAKSPRWKNVPGINRDRQYKKKFTETANERYPKNNKFGDKWKNEKKFTFNRDKQNTPDDDNRRERLMRKNQDIRNEYARVRKKNMKTKLEFAAKETAKTDFLLMEEKGYIEAEEGEDTCELTQHQIASAVDITSASKFFDLRLVQFGPYNVDYTRNGRHLLIGGRKGHLAAMDWLTKRLKCEINVMEEIQSVKWLHQETMFAVAQKEWVYMYDNKGIELHCIKSLDRVLRMEFLPYHWLLATSNENGFLSWLDTSIGQIVVQYPARMGRLDVMCQNPNNALLVLGHPQGVVSMWSPNQKQATTKMLCHKNPIKAVAVDFSGNYMATAAVNRSLKIWDLRNNKTCVQSYLLGGGANRLVFSQNNKLATSIGTTVEIYDDPCRQCVDKPFLDHLGNETISSMQFCPFEDVLGVGHAGGFTSLIVPGAGEANFDALEANPFQTKRQRGETEVKFLLDKIPSALICEDASMISKVNVVSAMERFEAKKKLLNKAPKVDFKAKHKTKGKGSSKKVFQKKQGLKEANKRKFIQNQRRNQKSKKNDESTSSSGCLLTDRFKKKIN